MDGLGSEQAIIVRNQESKNDLPEAFKKMKGLVLTTEECKGLEYNDVIIWNFFDPNLLLKWRILKSLDYFPQIGKTKFNLEDFNIGEHEELISELKMFYTMVTRARCTLIIYDLHIPEQFFHMWTSHKLVE